MSYAYKEKQYNGTTHTYIYDSVWKDKLISYDGKAITYDQFGCPITYMGATMTWDANGNLISITGETPNGTASNISYSYLSGGQRSEKTVDGVTTQYHYNNGMLLSETTGDETLRYFYDSAGRVASLTYKKGTNAEVGYFFARNYQSDIIAIYRSSDSKLIGTYEYDLWGRPISITESTTGIDTDGILTKNPFRYRGYYYDSETGFYNLNLRYYDPTICRFISADSMDVLTVETTAVNCKNLFSYCENNPVIARDSTGAFWDTLFDVASLVVSVVDVFRNPTNPEAWAGLVGDAVDLCPFVTGVGEAVKGGRLLGKADDFRDATKAAGNAHDATKATKKVGNANKANKPNQVHHFATNKSKTYTPQFKEITNKYGLDLDDAWNKELLPHQGRHPNKYHEYVLESMKQFDEVAQGDKDIFLELFEGLKANIRDNPDMLYKEYWN